MGVPKRPGVHNDLSDLAHSGRGRRRCGVVFTSFPLQLLSPETRTGIVEYKAGLLFLWPLVIPLHQDDQGSSHPGKLEYKNTLVSGSTFFTDIAMRFEV